MRPKNKLKDLIQLFHAGVFLPPLFGLVVLLLGQVIVEIKP